MKITIEQISAVLLGLVSFISAAEYLVVRMKRVFNKGLEPINARIDDLELTADKNFLVRVLSDMEDNKKLDEIEEERFYETYKRYHDLGGNSYIDNKVDKLKKEGKL